MKSPSNCASRRRFAGLVACAAFSIAFSTARADPPKETEWTPLLDQNLSHWEIWIGVPNPSVTVPGYTPAADPKQSQPLGLKNDPLHVYSVRMIDGEPVLHITGQIYGGLTSLKEYGNFHLRVQQRWGTAKYAPKLDKPRDNGLLYRCIGPHGAFNHVWKHSIECQVQENDIGDFFSLGVKAEVACKPDPDHQGPKPLYRYTPGEPLRLFGGRCARGADYHELPNGEWNTIEIMAVGDRSIHILNGHVVNVLQNAQSKETGTLQPVVSGQIQIQSEGAECEYRRVEIQPLEKFPAAYEALFTATPAQASPAAK